MTGGRAERDAKSTRTQFAWKFQFGLSVDLTCTGCEKRVTETWLEHDGVRAVDADGDEQRVAVTFTPQATSAASIRDSIAGLGYEIDFEPETDEP